MVRDVGLTNQHTKIIIQGFENILLPQQSLKVFIFGSRARGTAKKYSDIDLLVEASPGFNQQQVSRLEDYFEESDLPIKVDLVLQESLLEEFKPSVMADKKLFFEL